MPKYRIKEIPTLGYFAQVKFFLRWKTIGVHSLNQFGFYKQNHKSYPLKTYEEADKICGDCSVFLVKTKTRAKFHYI